MRLFAAVEGVGADRWCLVNPVRFFLSLRNAKPKNSFSMLCCFEWDSELSGRGLAQAAARRGAGDEGGLDVESSRIKTERADNGG